MGGVGVRVSCIQRSRNKVQHHICRYVTQHIQLTRVSKSHTSSHQFSGDAFWKQMKKGKKKNVCACVCCMECVTLQKTSEDPRSPDAARSRQSGTNHTDLHARSRCHSTTRAASLLCSHDSLSLWRCCEHSRLLIGCCLIPGAGPTARRGSSELSCLVYIERQAGK